MTVPLQDTLAIALPDSLASDSTVVDSVGAIEEMAQSVGETGRLLATGQWDLVWNRSLRHHANSLHVLQCSRCSSQDRTRKSNRVVLKRADERAGTRCYCFPYRSYRPRHCSG